MDDGNAETSSGTIATLFIESVFYSSEALENDGAEEENILGWFW